MEQAASARDARRRSHIVVALSAALVASSGVAAAEPKSVDGLLQFANVRVVDAPRSTAAGVPQGGMRAYKDSADSELRGPTTEELQAAAAASRSTLRGARSIDAAGDDEQATFAVPGGGFGVVLDESTMQYSVAVRRPDGSLEEVCVTGPQAAEAVVTMPRGQKTAEKREVRNVR